MKRFNLFEFHEQRWCPRFFRVLFHHGMIAVEGLFEVYTHVVPPLVRLIKRTEAEAVMDFGSGSGVPIHSLLQAADWNRSPKPEFVLSDLMPEDAITEAALRTHDDLRLRYHPEPVSVLDPPEDAPRVWTLFNLFHHFPPPEARRILELAAARTDAVAIIEVTERSWKAVVVSLFGVFFAPIIFLILVRPFRWSYLLFTLLIPVMPVMLVFDTLVSTLRSYTCAELEAMTREIDAPDYAWEVGTITLPKAPLPVTYLIGWRPDRVRWHGVDAERAMETAEWRREDLPQTRDEAAS